MNWRAQTAAAIAFLAQVAASDAAFAGETLPSFRLMWRIEPQAENTEVLQLKEGQLVTSARLLPVQSLIADADITTPDGKVIVLAGGELVRAATNAPNAIVACTLGTIANGRMDKFLFGSEKFGCFVDDDQDGDFDRFFPKDDVNNLGFLPNHLDFPKKGILVLNDQKYRVQSNHVPAVSPRIFLKYSNYAFISKWILFDACIGVSEKKCANLSENFGLRSPDVPGSFFAYGGEFRIIEKNKAGLKIQMLRPFISETMSFSF